MVIIICPRADTHRTTEENLGAEYIVSFLRSKGIEVVYIDAWLCNLENKKILEMLRKVKQPILVGLSMSMDSFSSGCYLSKSIKTIFPDVHLTTGGYKPTFSAEEVLKSCINIDSVCFGEGELTIFDLYKTLSAKKDWKKTRGLIYLDKNGTVIKNSPRTLIRDLNSLPFPCRDYINIVKKKKTPAHISASRGCYGNCSFCSINSFYKLCPGKKWRSRSVENIVEEICLLNKVHDIRSFKFVDDNFFSPVDTDLRVDKFCKFVRQKKLNIEFRISARANDMVEERIGKLVRIGLYSASVGVESGNQKSLNLFNKGTTVDQNCIALDISRKLGVYIQMGFILFNPLTDMESLVADYRFLVANKDSITKGIFSSLFLAEGTPITEMFVKKDVIKYKSGSNYIYEPINKKVAIVFRSLKLWAMNNTALRDKVIDPLSAPKVVPKGLRPQFLSLCIRVKKLDLYIFGTILKMVSSGVEENVVTKYVYNQIQLNKSFWKTISEKTDTLYLQGKLEYDTGRNKYII